MRLPFEFTYPWALPALVGLPLVWWLARSAIALVTPKRRRLSWVLRCLVALCVGLALADLRWRNQTDRQEVVWLVDASRSVGQGAIEAAGKFIAAANQAVSIPRQSIVAFAGQASALADAEALKKLNPASVADTATDIQQALNFADANFPAGYNKTVVLFSDGVETAGDLARQFAGLRERGIRVHTVLVKPPDNPEVLVRAVTAPRTVALHEPFRVTTEIVSNREQTAQFDLFRNAVKVGTKEVTLHVGLNRFETNQSVNEGQIVEYVAQVRATQDTLAGNNSASAVVQSRGKSRILLLSDKPELSKPLYRALEPEGVELDVRPASGAPVDFADLQSFDLVIVDNVPATDLSPNQMKLMASYVRDFGGGFLMLGGDKAFGLGGYFRTPIEDLLPVRCDFMKDKENPSLGMLIIIDHSGSMNGQNKMEMAKEAAKSAVELLSPQDYVAVMAFDTTAYWVAPFESATDKAGVESKISTIQAGGGTNIASSLELAEDAMRSVPAKIKHVVLLTDGQSVAGQFNELINRLVGGQVTLSTVGVGSDADQNILQQMAEWGHGRFYFTDNPQNIPQIFARETMMASKSSLQDSPFQAKVIRSADFLDGIPWDNAPFLLGQVLVKAKPTADLWMVSERGDPLLATWRYGLGQGAAFTSDARNRWAGEWITWEGFSNFWVQLTRKLRRPAALKNFPATIAKESGGFRLKIDAVNEQGGFLSDLEGEAIVLGPDHSEKKIPLELTAPGQFETFWPSKDPGAYYAQVVLKRDGKAVEQQAVVATLGYPDEYLLQPPDEAMLRQLAAGTGGKYNPGPAEILNGDPRTAEVQSELWPWLIGLALFLFVADVAARRWPESDAPLGASPRRAR